MRIYLRLLIVVLAIMASGLWITSAEAAVPQCSLINSYLKLGANNDVIEVTKLQLFLNSVVGEQLTVSGFFDERTRDAVLRFQALYSNEILKPWGITVPTGNVYVTTRHTINEIFCSKKMAYTAAEKALLNPVATVKAAAVETVVKAPEDATLTGSTQIVTTASTSMPDSLSSSITIATTTETSADENLASTSSSFGNTLRGIFSSSITLVILLILLALVIYAMVTNREVPPATPKK